MTQTVITPERDAYYDSLHELRVSVARMEGMLSQALTDQSQRITRAEADIGSINVRLNDKAKVIATHGERIKANSDRIHELEEDKQGFHGRVLGTIGAIVAAAALIVSLVGPPPL